MGQSRDTLKEEYKELLLLPDFEEKQFTAHCIQFLEKHDVKSCFKFLPLDDIGYEFLENATVTEDAKYHNLCNVFQQLEKYAARLVVKPWCKDLYTIKVYTGHFKYNFERWISTDTVYRVFELIGYKPYKTAPPGTLILQPPPDEKRVLALGLDLYLAHTQLSCLRNTKFLSSEYLMKDVMEGWMNTTGNVVNIVEWISKNKIETKEQCGFKEIYLSSNEAPATTRSEFVTTNGKVSHFDKNGHPVKSQVRYPPRFSEAEYIVLCKQQGESNASSNSFSSLVTLDVLDSVLYGGGDHDTSLPQNSKIASDSSEAKGSFSVPYLATNGNYENLNGEDGIQSVYSRVETDASSYQPKRNKSTRNNVLSSSSEQRVVSRGRKLENYDSYSYLTTDSSMYGNIISNKMGHATRENLNDNDGRMHSPAHGQGADGDILMHGKKYVELLDKRIKNAQKYHGNQNFMLNEDFMHNIDDDCENSSLASRSYVLQQDVVDGSVKYENASEPKTYEEGPLSEEKCSITNTLSDVLKNTSDSCIVCGKPPAFGCQKCKEVACECCYESVWKRRPCLENEHQCYRISSV